MITREPVERAPVEIDQTQRMWVLQWASALTTEPADPRAVVANAKPLLAWLAQANSAEDLQARVRALLRQHTNWVTQNGTEPDDDPHRLLADALALYEFLADDAGDIDGPDTHFVT